MSCPFNDDNKAVGAQVTGSSGSSSSDSNNKPGAANQAATSTNGTQASPWDDPDGGMLYGEYLLLDQLLSCQEPVTRYKFTHHRKSEVHDEHLFIITHQTYELWFKQIIFELDSVRQLLNEDQVDEANMLQISSRLDRIRKIMGVLADQFSILETMTPLDFMEFRDYLAPASGFQSYQFRLIENKLGIKNENRCNYKPNQVSQPYLDVFKDPKCIEAIKKSESEPSLFKLIERWLERTPGLEEDGFNFVAKYTRAVNQMLQSERDKIRRDFEEKRSKIVVSQEEADARLKMMLDDVEKKKLKYMPILDQNEFLRRNLFRFSQRAMHGALMISLYRDEPRFNQPYQVLVKVMDIDSRLTKWRQNHTSMVLRMIGSDTLGTGGSSGVSYLKATQTPRYNVFFDLFNLSTYLISKEFIPELTPCMRKRLSTIDE